MINYREYKEKNNEYYSGLRKGNFVGVLLRYGCPEFGGTIIQLPENIGEKSVSFCIDYPDSGFIEPDSTNIQNLYPIPLNNYWRSIIDKKINITSEIKYVHEFQNWYSIMHRKQEFEFDEVEMSEGDNVATHQLEKMLMSEIYSGEQLSF